MAESDVLDAIAALQASVNNLATTADIDDPILAAIAAVQSDTAWLADEMVKIPKADAAVSWNATAATQITAQAAAALNAALPGSPTANSINERVKALDDDWNNGGRLDLLLDGLPVLFNDLADTADITALFSAAFLAGADALASAILHADLGDGTNDVVLNERTVRSSLRFLRNKWSISGTTLTVKTENDSTTAWTAELTGTAGADPVTAQDPT